MKRILTVILVSLTLQSYAAVMPYGSVARQIQDSLNRSTWILNWNEGVWIDLIKIPYDISEEIKAKLLSKTTAEWLDVVSNGSEAEQQEANSALGVSYLFGVGAKQSEEMGLLYLQVAADKGRANSAQYIALAYGGGIGKITEDYVEALKWYKLADKLNTTSENKFDLGAMYLRAAEQATVRKDYKQAADIHKESLALGHKQPAPYLTALYAAGLGVNEDMDKALEYAKQVDIKTLFDNDDDYNKFGDKLSPETIVALIKMNTSARHSDVYKRSGEYHQARLMLSEAVNKNDPIGAYVAHKAAYQTKDFGYAAHVLNIAAEAGLPAAQYEVADTLARINIEPEYSFKMFKKAAENGYSKAFLRYGSELYNRGKHSDSLSWMDKASKYEVGKHSANGKPYIGVATDEYIKSVELLAKLYFNGEGVEHNKDKALELVDELIKQVNGRISMKKIQVSPDSRWRPNNFNSRDEQIQHYNNQLNGYMSKFTELVNLKRMMMDIKQ